MIQSAALGTYIHRVSPVPWSMNGPSEASEKCEELMAIDLFFCGCAKNSTISEETGFCLVVLCYTEGSTLENIAASLMFLIVAVVRLIVQPHTLQALWCVG
jgi:hypothetical protein